MKNYKNPDSRRVRGSHVLEIRCAYCKCFIARYQKVGESNLVKMYHDRIVESSMDLSLHPGAVHCPNCGQRIATRYTTSDKQEAYRLTPSGFNKKKEKR